MNPGTVSKILWHFTGGPIWNEALNKQAEDPKPMELANEILLKILDSKQLRISNYSEVVKVLIPEISVWNQKERKREKNIM